jgi:hypothetical protein
MANTTLNYESFVIVGDGVSTTAAINLGYTPATATFISAISIGAGDPVDVSSSVTSVTLAGQTVTVTFVAPFSGTVSITLNVVAPNSLLTKQVVYTSVAPANPAAGAGVSLTVPAGMQYVINAVRMTFATSATAGNRIISLAGEDAAGHQMVQNISTYSQPASTTTVTSFASGSPATTTPVYFTVTQPMAASYLGPGGTFIVGIVGIQAADQLSNVFFMVQATTL